MNLFHLLVRERRPVDLLLLPVLINRLLPGHVSLKVVQAVTQFPRSAGGEREGPRRKLRNVEALEAAHRLGGRALRWPHRQEGVLEACRQEAEAKGV